MLALDSRVECLQSWHAHTVVSQRVTCMCHRYTLTRSHYHTVGDVLLEVDGFSVPAATSIDLVTRHLVGIEGSQVKCE